MARFEVNERTAAKYSMTLKDTDGNTVSSTQLNSFTLTLYNRSDSTGTFINSRGSTGGGQNVLNLNDVTVSTGGAVVWSMQAEDNIIVDATAFRSRGEEEHIALFAWQWGGSTGQLGRHRRQIFVQDFDKTS